MVRDQKQGAFPGNALDPPGLHRMLKAGQGDRCSLADPQTIDLVVEFCSDPAKMLAGTCASKVRANFCNQPLRFPLNA